MNEQVDSWSTREKNLWFDLIVDAVVALYYWPQAFRLIFAGDDALRGVAMVNLITSTVMYAIFLGVALSVFLHTRRKPEPMDERDYMIAARASLLASRVLVGALIALIGLVVLVELPGNGAPSHLMAFPLSPLVLAHLVLVALMLWSFTGTLARLYFYRKGL